VSSLNFAVICLAPQKLLILAVGLVGAAFKVDVCAEDGGVVFAIFFPGIGHIDSFFGLGAIVCLLIPLLFYYNSFLERLCPGFDPWFCLSVFRSLFWLSGDYFLRLFLLLILKLPFEVMNPFHHFLFLLLVLFDPVHEPLFDLVDLPDHRILDFSVFLLNLLDLCSVVLFYVFD
jgi:hypothetical protein